MNQQYTVEEFCDAHYACKSGRDWAIANCATMQDAWLTARPEWVIWIATRPGALSDKDLRLFAVWAARQVQHLMKDQRSLDALNVAEEYAVGTGIATSDELAVACEAAWEAAWAAARAAWAAAWAARAARATQAAAWAAWAAAWAAQAKYLQENTTPNFNKP